LANALNVPGAKTAENGHPKHVVKKRTGKTSRRRKHKSKSPSSSRPKRLAPLEVAANARATGAKVRPMHRYDPSQSPVTSPVPTRGRRRSKKSHKFSSPGDVLFVDANIPLPPQKYKAPEGLAVKTSHDPSILSAWEKAELVNLEQDEADMRAAQNRAIIGKKTKARGKKALKIARLEQRYNQLAADLMTTIEEEEDGEEANGMNLSPLPPPSAPAPNDFSARLKAKYDEIMADADAQLKYLNSENMETETFPKRNAQAVRPTNEPQRQSTTPRPIDERDKAGPSTAWRTIDEVRVSAPLTAASDFAAIAKARLDQLMAMGEELETVTLPPLPVWGHPPNRVPPPLEPTVTIGTEKRKPLEDETPFSHTPSDFAARLKAKFDEIMTTGEEMEFVSFLQRDLVEMSEPQLPQPRPRLPFSPKAPSPSATPAPIPTTPTAPIPTNMQEEGEEEIQEMSPKLPGAAPTSSTRHKEQNVPIVVVTTPSTPTKALAGREGKEAETIPQRKSRPQRKEKVNSKLTAKVPPPPQTSNDRKKSEAAQKCLRHYMTKLLKMNPDKLEKLSDSRASSLSLSNSSIIRINSSTSTCVSNGSVTASSALSQTPNTYFPGENQSQMSSKSPFFHPPQETSTPNSAAAAWVERFGSGVNDTSSASAGTGTTPSSLSSKFPEVNVNVAYDSGTTATSLGSPVDPSRPHTPQDNLSNLLAGLCQRQAHCLTSPPPSGNRNQSAGSDGRDSLEFDHDIQQRFARLMDIGKPPGTSSENGSTSDEGRLRGGTSSLLPMTATGIGTSTDDDAFQLSNSPLNISVGRERIPHMIGQVADRWRRISLEPPQW